ncbi:immunity 53 family protein [Metabacillus idriensis]|uniref:immunity 53 family protein n=1 Tax=Metabacillus idriensis TaxID=324768 RepID=UPI0021E51F93|nr:immunity 53 family protein [Metabacillus idriensis]
MQNWYLKQCDGDWEHQFGIRIDTLDNPGWSVKISITDTELLGKTFEKVEIERSSKDWIYCKVGLDDEMCGLYFIGVPPHAHQAKANYYPKNEKNTILSVL